MGDWLNASMSKIGLAPLSMKAIPKRAFLPSALDDAEDSKPYVLEKPDRRDRHVREGKPANVFVAAWRKDVGWIQRIFRWLNQSAYLASVPFIIILLFGIAVKAHSIAIFGATFVVLLNIGRIVAGAANLAVIPLKDGFDFRKYKKPLRRVIEPIVTIALVVLAFTFIPWLSTGKASTGTIAERLRSSAESLQTEIEGEVGRVKAKAKDLNLDKLGNDVVEKANKLGTQAQEKLKGLGGAAGDDAAQPPPDDTGGQPQKASVKGLLKDVERGARRSKNCRESPEQATAGCAPTGSIGTTFTSLETAPCPLPRPT